MRVLKDRLLLRRIRLPFCLIGRFARFEIDGSAEVFLRVQDVENRRAVPVIWLGDAALFPRACVQALTFKIGRRGHPFFALQNPCDSIRVCILSGQFKDTPDSFRRLRLDEPAVPIFGVFDIAKAGRGHNRRARHALGMIADDDFSGLIAQIHFVQHVEHRHKLDVVAAGAVNMAVDSDKMNGFLLEVNLRVEARLQVVASDAAHVLDQHRVDFISFNIGKHPLPAGAVEIAAAPSVVRIVLAVGESMLIGVILQIELLVYDRVAFPVEVIVAGQALVQRRNQIFLH